MTCADEFYIPQADDFLFVRVETELPEEPDQERQIVPFEFPAFVVTLSAVLGLVLALAFTPPTF